MAHPLERYRAFFPACERYAYLNHAAVAPTSTLAVDAARAWLDDLLHHGVVNEHGWEERAERARASCARLVGAEPAEIAIVRNTSHGLGLVAEGLDWKPGDEVAVCAALEYPSNVYVWQHLADRGVALRPIEPLAGGVRPEAVERALTPKTRLLAVSSVQYATGHKTDLASIGKLCRDRGVLLCVDGIQSVGSGPLDARALGVDFLAADSHKWMLGMTGVGLLYVRRELATRLRPVLVGWKSTKEAWNFDRATFDLRDDAARFEEGSPMYAATWALGAAADLLLEVGLEAVEARVAELLSRLEERLVAAGCDVSPGPSERGGILTFAPRTGDAAAVAEAALARGVVVSVRRGRVRVSPHFYTTEAEVDRLAEVVEAAGLPGGAGCDSVSAMALGALMAIVFGAFLTEAIVGFGSTVLTVTLGSHFLKLDELLPAFVPLNVVLSSALLARGRRSVDAGFLLKKVGPAVGLGTAAGLVLFQFNDRLSIQLGFSLFVVLLALVELRRVAVGAEVKASPMNAAAAGALLLFGGVIHGLFGSGGPMIVYVAGRQIDDKLALRSTLALLWLVLNLVLIANYLRLGLISATSLGRGAALLPSLGLALALGEVAHRRLPARPFRLLVGLVLLIAGLSLAGRTLGSLTS